MSDRPTKERILDAAEQIMLEKSFHSVGLNEILKAVGVPKGSFYHHFESKEQFGVEMLKHYVADAVANAWYEDAGVYHQRFEEAFAQVGIDVEWGFSSKTACCWR